MTPERAAYQREWRQKNRAKCVEYSTRWRAKNKDHVLAYRRKHRRQNIKKATEAHTKWRAERSPEMIERCKQKTKEWQVANAGRFKALARLDRHRMKMAIIHEYGGKCDCCGDSHIEFLSIDHIDGKGHLHKKELGSRNLYRWLKMNGYPKDNFRLLCMNCNFSLGKIGYCPHQGMKMFVNGMGG